MRFCCALRDFSIHTAVIWMDWQDRRKVLNNKTEDLLKVGVITSPHGVRGEAKVFPTTDDPQRFLDLKEIIIDTKKEKKTLEITQVKFVKNLVVLKFKGIDDRNEIENMRQMELYVTRDKAVELGENEYFIADLIDLEVASDEEEALGHISDVLQSAANDIYVISKEGQQDILVPAIKECILNVDMENRKMTVHLLPGLREVNQK